MISPTPMVKRAMWRLAPSTLRRLLGPAEWHYSIGILNGESPLTLADPQGIVNPVLTRHDVTDCPAGAVADPFLFWQGTGWTMFFEVVNQISWRGEIAYATSADGYAWDYRCVVLREPFHLSYPYVFSWQGDVYLIPESAQAESVRLYRADPFPEHWTYVCDLLSGGRFVDSSIFRYEDHWWLLTEAGPTHLAPILRLFFSDSLQGPWREHPNSPVVHGDLRFGRPSGRVIRHNGKLIRYTQNLSLDVDDDRQVRALEITDLSPSRFSEEPVLGGSPVLGPGDSVWDRRGKHHIDAHELGKDQWLASVDGLNEWCPPPRSTRVLST